MLGLAELVALSLSLEEGEGREVTEELDVSLELAELLALSLSLIEEENVAVNEGLSLRLGLGDGDVEGMYPQAPAVASQIAPM